MDVDIKFQFNYDMIFFDTQNEKIYISCTDKLYDFSDILNIEIVNNNDTIAISRTTGTNQKKVSFSKAIIGDMLYGPAGAIIGGTAGKTKVNETTDTENKSICKNLDIIFVFKEERVKIPFLYKPEEINSYKYNYSKEKFDELVQIIQTITKPEENVQNSTYVSREDIKGKLIDLKDMLIEGLITEEEYEQKRRDILKRM